MGNGTQQLLLKAHTAHRAGHFAQAEAGYRSVLRIRPKDPDALHFLGMLHYQRGDHAAAIDWIRKSLASLPSNPHAWNNLGNMLIAANDLDGANEAYERATHFGSQMAEAWYNRAIGLRRARRYEEAVASFTRTIELRPEYASVYERLGMMLYSLGRFREAADIYRRWLGVDAQNPIARHMLAALTDQDVPARADDDYLRRLFDTFADSFDENLADLGYRAPELLAAVVSEFVRANQQVELLDAGCGTGLCGPLLRSFASKLVGVDISAGMVEKARVRGTYDELHVAELVGWLKAHPQAFDVVLSADTLVYFGALDEFITVARAALRPRGLLTFTVEQLLESDEQFRIQPHGRYAHRADYLRRLLEEAGFQHVELREVGLRQERGSEVRGYAVVATCPGAGEQG